MIADPGNDGAEIAIDGAEDEQQLYDVVAANRNIERHNPQVVNVIDNQKVGVLKRDLGKSTWRV